MEQSRRTGIILIATYIDFYKGLYLCMAYIYIYIYINGRILVIVFKMAFPKWGKFCRCLT